MPVESGNTSLFLRLWRQKGSDQNVNVKKSSARMGPVANTVNERCYSSIQRLRNVESVCNFATALCPTRFLPTHSCSNFACAGASEAHTYMRARVRVRLRVQGCMCARTRACARARASTWLGVR
eukprot:1521729-Pleurochrysis_carterae.AAC.1